MSHGISGSYYLRDVILALRDVFVMLIILTDRDFVQYSATLLLYTVELFSNFHLLVNLGAHFWVTLHVTRYSNGHLPDSSRQSVLKNQNTAQ